MKIKCICKGYKIYDFKYKKEELSIYFDEQWSTKYWIGLFPKQITKLLNLKD